MSHTPLPQINLYDPALLEVHDPWTLRNVALAALGIVLVMSVWAGLATHRKNTLQAELAALEASGQGNQAEIRQLATQLAERKPDPALERELAQAQAHHASRTEVLAVLMKGLTPEALTPADVLSGLARQVPAGVWLTEFSLNLDNGELDISGGTNDPAQIAAYVAALGSEKAFAGRTFAELEVKHSSKLAQAAVPVVPGAPAVLLPLPGAAATPGAPVAAAVPPHHQFRLSSSLRPPTTGAAR